MASLRILTFFQQFATFCLMECFYNKNYFPLIGGVEIISKHFDRIYISPQYYHQKVTIKVHIGV